MLIKQGTVVEDDQLYSTRTFDMDPTFRSVQRHRDATGGRDEIGVCIGEVPMWLVYQWLREAGVDPSDSNASDEVLKKKLLSGEFSRLRIYEGNV